MNKLTTLSNKRLIIGASVAGLLVIVALGLTLRNPIRTRLVPNVVGVFYRQGVSQTLEDQNRSLNDPMARLLGSIPLHKTSCYSQQLQGIHSELGCQAGYQAIRKLSGSETDKTTMMKTVATIESQLQARGYHHGQNGVSLTSLVDGTYKGIDYTPDAYYEKVIGQYDCVFDTSLAYANPQPPAIRVSMWCDRTFNFLGAPKGETYRSQDGTPAYHYQRF